MLKQCNKLRCMMLMIFVLETITCVVIMWGRDSIIVIRNGEIIIKLHVRS